MTDTITRDEVMARLEGDWKFVERALLFIADRQTEIERVTKSTIYKNRRGLSVPLARIGTDLAETIRDGGAVSWQDIVNAIEVCAYHWRQAAMLMLTEQGLSMDDAAYCVYPIKTPRRAPRAAGRGREERLVDRETWAWLVEIELDQEYQRELMAKLRASQERSLDELLPVSKGPAEIIKLEEVFIEGLGIVQVAS